MGGEMIGNGTTYRAKDAENLRLFHTGGCATDGKPLEDHTMKGLAESIAYLYHRHNVILYESENGRRFRKVDKKKQDMFDKIMSAAFYEDEHRG